jgi:endonuclease/exonuclease/phosphatase family metal-dependent hydrolase
VRLISWNIQNGLGVDGVLSLDRIAEVIVSMGEADVICLQEVSVNMLLADGSTTDQVKRLTELFDGFKAFFGVAVDMLDPYSGGRAQYGNLVFSRYPVQSVFYHSLPQPADGNIKQMPRQMVEVVVETPNRLIRVMTTHLEFHSERQRSAQTKRIMEIQSHVHALENDPPNHQPNGPYGKIQRPSSCILCGDFNFLTNSAEYRLVTEAKSPTNELLDAWMLTNSGEAHPPTCGIHDGKQWPQGPHCRDFMFVTEDLAEQVVQLSVDTDTNASDHQPLRIVLKDT